MTRDMVEVLQAVDPVVLLDVVRQDQRSPTFEILSWVVEPLSDKGIVNPAGLFAFRGNGHDARGLTPWRVVLKILKKPHTELAPHHLRYWKRELLAMQSGLLATLPGPVVAPRCYGTSEFEDSGWIWMEHILESTNSTWTTSQYVFAARELGRFNGNCLLNPPLPNYPWLCKGHVRTKSEGLAPHDAWESLFVSQAFSNQTHQRIMQLWNERNRFYDALERLPQVFSHFDYHRRNLIIRHQEDGTDQVVALDWAWGGHGALGADLYSIVGGSALIFELEVTDVDEVERAAFEAYLAGLHDAGWVGNPEIVRLAYTICFAMFLAACAPALTAYATMDNMNSFVVHQFKRSRTEVASGWAALCELALDRADEARTLMNQLL